MAQGPILTRAQRRRTQIRLAQRAYRLRKETTISSLRTRVAELETAIDGMQSTFMELRASTQGLIKADEHEMAKALNALTDRFLALASAAHRSEAGESLGEEDHGDDRSRRDPDERPKSRDDGGPTSGGGAGNPSGQVQTTWGDRKSVV